MSLFTSAKERKRQDREYEKRIFPLGTGQREAEEALLHQLITSDVNANERLYHLIQLRDLLQTEDEPDDLRIGLQKWYGSRYARYLTPAERARVYALALLTQGCTSLDEYPTPEQVTAKGEELLAGEMADWPEKQERASIFSWGQKKK